MDFDSAGATIHLFRKPAYSAGVVPFSVRIDGVEAAKILPNESIKLAIRPGEHRIQVTMWSRQGSHTLTFQVARGQAVGFVCQGTMRPLHPIALDRDDTVTSGAPASPSDMQGQPQFQARSPAQAWAGAAPAAPFGQPGPFAPPAPAAPTQVEVVETDQFEEPLGEEVRVIDNQRSATGVTRSVKASREWSRTMSIGGERTRTFGAELGGGPAWLKVKGSVEQQLHRTYSTEEQAKQVFAEEITLTVPARTSVRLVLRWKRIWQRGVVRVTEPDGAVHEVPYQVVVNVTFDQSQEDATPDDVTTKLYWTPPAAAGGPGS